MLHFFKKKSIPAQKELAVKAVIDFVGVHLRGLCWTMEDLAETLQSFHFLML